MNPADADPLQPEAPPADTGTEAAVEKPKRRRAPRSAAAAPAEEAAAPPVAADFSAPSAEELFTKPRRAAKTPAARKTRAKVDAAVAEAPAADAAPVPAERTVAPALEAGAPRALDAERQGPAGTVSSASAHAGAASGEGEARDGADQGRVAAEGDGDSEDRPRRGRNRRRGRRGGDRDRGAEGAVAGVDAAVPGENQPPRVTGPLAEEVFAQVLSGAYDDEPALADEGPSGPGTAVDSDAEPMPLAEQDAEVAVPPAEAISADAAEPAKRVLAPEPDAPKLHKVLAQAGVGSRRDLEQMITDNRVTVNGAVAHTGQRISFGDRIQIDGKPVRYRIAPPPARVLAYHKPTGEVVTHDDPQQRPTVFRRLPRLQQGKWQSVGRLDINTEGLLLFTTSGELANQLMHPRFGVEREYAVRSLGVLGQEAKAKLLEGVEIDGQRCAFKSIEDGGGEGVNHWYRCVITEGRNREVRKLFETVGHAVSRLIRIRYGSVVLPRGLKRGVWVDLDEHDLRNLRRLASGPRPEPAERAEGPPAGDAPRNERGGRNRERDRDRRGGGKRGNNDAAVRAERPPQPERQMRNDRPDRPDRQDRPPRGDRPDRGPRPPRPERREAGEGGNIPNPLQQTFDKRAIQQERALRREMPEDGPIPNPLQQTYDKRALQRDRMPQRDIPDDGPIPNPLQQTYDKRFANGGGQRGPAGVPGAGGLKRGRGGAKGGGGKQGGRGGQQGGGGDPAHIPDPMKTSMGYIGADAFHRKGGGGGGGGRGGPRRNSGGGTGGGGGGGRGGRGGRGPAR